MGDSGKLARFLLGSAKEILEELNKGETTALKLIDNVEKYSRVVYYALEKLKEMGLVERKVTTEGRIKTYYRITEKGKKVLEKIKEMEKTINEIEEILEE